MNDFVNGVIFLTESLPDILDQLLNVDPVFKQTYEVLNKLQAALQHKDWNNHNVALLERKCSSEEMLKYFKLIMMKFIITTLRSTQMDL
ncbi:hypothetical protein [Pediococcus acidilactici]|uniref:hypothetical protein n=1 Tax=Pediococcus acidilactici TaxID=1254 RepID=UPI001330D68A|nr:hypothetical protein [Pediococcus acidilactici]